MKKVACSSEILSRIQRFPLRKVGVYPKESPSLHRVNSQRTRNRGKRTSDCLKKEVHSCLSGFQDGRSSLETSLKPPIDLPSELPCLRTKGGVKGGLWEIYGRSCNNTSRAKTPLYTGTSKENGRSRHIIMQFTLPSGRRSRCDGQGRHQ